MLHTRTTANRLAHALITNARAASALWRRRELAPDRVVFRRTATELLRTPVAGLSEYAFVDLAASTAPWTAAHLRLDTGDRVTLVACGRTDFAPLLGAGLGPAHQIWARVGAAGPISRGPRAARTLTAPRDGVLELGPAFPGEWSGSDGATVGARWRWRTMRGGFTVLVLRWDESADLPDALRTFAEAWPEQRRLLLSEAEALEHGEPRRAPPGWGHHPAIGESAVFDAAHTHIDCVTHGDTGIIRYPVDIALDRSTRLRWSWRVDELPSRLPEDSLLSHDYLSIAVEFDDGRDLTYQWSSSLPPGLVYRCPLPHWCERETHVVVRSGHAALGRWVDDDRPLLADHAAAIGGTAPRAVVAVWLIANSALQRRRGACAYRQIELSTDGVRCLVGPRPPA